jgi:hypothetical protein
MASLLERRRIEAEFAKAMLDEMSAELGRQKAVELVAKAVIKLARQAGEAFAEHAGGHRPDLIAYSEILEVWQTDDALSLELLVQEKDKLEFNVTRCRYAEMYRELDLSDLGGILSCNRDLEFCTGFNPDIDLARTHTLMEGASHCDFRYMLRK